MEMTTQKKENINNPDEVLRELATGIIAVGIVGQIFCLFFSQIFFESMGWWLGIAVALFMGWHMYHNLGRILGLAEGDAISAARTGAIIRYAVALGIMLVVYFTGWVSGVTYVLGIFSLKIGAYLQPVTHKIFLKFKNKNK